MSDLIKEVVFKCIRFEDSLKTVEKRRLCLFGSSIFSVDKKSFTKYTKIGFDFETHCQLFKTTNKFKEKGEIFNE